MTRAAIAILLALVIGCLVACEPTQPPAFARRSSAPAIAAPTAGAPGASSSPGASAGASPSAEAPTGSPRVEVGDTTVTVVGRGDKLTSVFALDGAYAFKLTPCPGTGVIPFIFIFEEFGQGRGQYVKDEFTVKNLVGNFFLRVSGPPTCAWTVTLTKA